MFTLQDYNKIVVLIGVYKANQPDWRTGQCLFNAIYSIVPELGDDIRGTEYDSYYTKEEELIIKCWIYLDSLIEE